MDLDEVPYEGFFYDSLSSDIVAKVVFNIFLLLFIIIVVSWSLSRRNPRLFPSAHFIPYDFDYFTLAGVITLAGNNYSATEGITATRTGSKWLYVLRNWCIIIQAKHSYETRTLCSHLSRSFLNCWRGIQFSNQFVSGYSDLRILFEYTFAHFCASSHLRSARIGIRNFKLSTIQKYYELGSEAFNSFALNIIFGTVLLQNENPDKGQQKALKTIGEQLTLCMDFYMYGKSSGTDINAEEFICSIESLMEPIVTFEIERVATQKMDEDVCDEDNNEWNFVVPTSPPLTLLSQLLVNKHLLQEEEGISFDSLTTSQIIHSLFEVLLIGRYALSRCLNVLFVVLSARVDWQMKVVQEVSAHSKNCFSCGICSLHEVTESHAQDALSCTGSNCLPWTKALCLETLRFTVAGWPFGALSRAARDGQLGDLEYSAGDLFLFNEPAVFHDPNVWFQAGLDREDACVFHTLGSNKRAFNPFNFFGRFINDSNETPTTTTFLATSVLLNSNVLLVPRSFVFQSLLTAVLEFYNAGLIIKSSEQPKRATRYIPLGGDFPRVVVIAQSH